MNARMIDKIIALLNPQRHKGEKSYLSTILTEYKNKRPNYEEFRIAAHRALEALLKEGEYKYQIISRTKTHERLKKNLRRKKEHGFFYHWVEGVEDLGGFRKFFYPDRERKKFEKK